MDWCQSSLKRPDNFRIKLLHHKMNMIKVTALKNTILISVFNLRNLPLRNDTSKMPLINCHYRYQKFIPLFSRPTSHICLSSWEYNETDYIFTLCLCTRRQKEGKNVFIFFNTMILLGLASMYWDKYFYLRIHLCPIQNLPKKVYIPRHQSASVMQNVYQDLHALSFEANTQVKTHWKHKGCVCTSFQLSDCQI